jgi:group I intron endonuclease
MFIYRLTGPTGKVYIGKTERSEVNKRWKEHFRYSKDLSRLEHLYCAIRKHGWKAFTKEIIESVQTTAQLNAREQYWIDFYDSTNPVKGYNHTNGGTGGNTWLGLTESEVAERKARTSKKRKPTSEETKNKLSEARKAWLSKNPNPCKGRTPWNKGLKETAEQIEAKRQRQLGKKDSLETRKKKSEALKGKNKYPKTEAHKQKLREANLGKKLSKETRAKMSESRKGKPQRILTCPHCGKQGGTTMYRWHFDKCKEKDK